MDDCSYMTKLEFRSSCLICNTLSTIDTFPSIYDANSNHIDFPLHLICCFDGCRIQVSLRHLELTLAECKTILI